MNRLPLLFLGIFFTAAFSWTGLVLASYLQLGGLQPASSTLVNAAGEDVAGAVNPRDEQWKNKPGEETFPKTLNGLAQQGKAVYASMGCLYCHSQQVRRPGVGRDFERGWGNRQSVARDYIRQTRVMLGTMRTGPDLTNIGLRQAGEPGRTWHHLHLYNPQITSPGSNMPPFAFLYEVRPIGPDGPSPNALQFSAAVAAELQPKAGYEVVPTLAAEQLVEYLLSLNIDYDLPEAKRKE